MKVAPDHVVSFHYTLCSEAGEVIDSSEGKAPITYLHGHQTLRLFGLEEEIVGRHVGEEVGRVLPPAQAFGERDPQKVRSIPRETLPSVESLKAGGRYTTLTPQGRQAFTVVEIRPETVVLDFNHPLAGQNVVLSVKVVEIRKATPQELQWKRVIQTKNKVWL